MFEDTDSTIPSLHVIADDLQGLFDSLDDLVQVYNEHATHTVSGYAMTFMVEELDEDGEAVFDVGIHSNLGSRRAQREFIASVCEALEAADEDEDIEYVSTEGT